MSGNLSYAPRILQFWNEVILSNKFELNILHDFVGFFFFITIDLPDPLFACDSKHQ